MYAHDTDVVSSERPAAERAATLALLLLPGVLTAYLAFNTGGFFPGATALAVLALIAALIAHLLAARSPFAGFSPAAAIAVCALGALSVWTLASGFLSDSAGRGLLEFDRALLYLLGLSLFALLGRSALRVRLAAIGAAAGLVAVCAAGFLTRTLPEVLPITPGPDNDVLGFPVTYSNTMGLLSALAAILCLHLASNDESRAVRCSAAALLPVMAATLLLTFSRGGIAVLLLGCVLYAGLVRNRGVLGALVVAVPTCALAVAAALGADALATDAATSARAVAQGQDVFLTTLACAVAAGLLRLLSLPVERRLPRMRPRPLARRLAVAGVVLLAIAVAVPLGAPAWAADKYDEFVTGNSLTDVPTARDRLSMAGNNGRLDHWKVAAGGFAADPVLGGGAGSFEVLWARERTSAYAVHDAHSLYLEVAAELGVLGLGALLLAIGVVLVTLARRFRAERRPVYAALLAVGVAWAVRAGIDWDWEMPAATLWFFMLGGLALSRPHNTVAAASTGRGPRLALAVGLLALAMTPVAVAASQVRLNDSVAAFQRGDCDRAISAALDSARALPARPEPFQVLGFCDARLGLHGLSQDVMRKAVDREPKNWEYRYSLAVVQAAAGRDPRAELREARRLNPREPMVRDLSRRIGSSTEPGELRSRAQKARLPFPSSTKETR